jgi:transposase
MRQKSDRTGGTPEKLVRDIRWATRKQYSTEEKIRIVLDGPRGEESISELGRREGIAASMYDSAILSPIVRIRKKSGGKAHSNAANPVNGGTNPSFGPLSVCWRRGR